MEENKMLYFITSVERGRERPAVKMKGCGSALQARFCIYFKDIRPRLDTAEPVQPQSPHIC